MSSGAWILMCLVLVVVWGGWAGTLYAVVRQERRKAGGQRPGDGSPT